VLGLSKHRWKATHEQIKDAYHKKALRHHPDKKKAQGKEDNDSFFKCMQRAMEIISDPVKRRQFDSVDEAADVEPPSKKEVQKRGFFKMWNPVFESEARFSNKQPVPMLGDENSTKQEVDDFYDFWYNFDSWRSFEYLDDDVPDDNEGRDHKRHVEKKNANSRRKKKTEDTSRLRQVVDQALEQDERIKKFRQESKANKNKKKNEREAAAKLEAEEKQKAKEEEERKQKAAEEAAKAERVESKKTKEAAKNAVKKNKRVLKGSVKDVNYFATGGEASATQIDGVLTDVELIMGKIDADELAALASKLNLAGKDAGKVQGAYEDEAKRLVGGGKIKEGDLKILKS
jgi:DnaJ homolog subfamily C member 2